MPPNVPIIPKKIPRLAVQRLLLSLAVKPSTLSKYLNPLFKASIPNTIANPPTSRMPKNTPPRVVADDKIAKYPIRSANMLPAPKRRLSSASLSVGLSFKYLFFFRA